LAEGLNGYRLSAVFYMPRFSKLLLFILVVASIGALRAQKPQTAEGIASAGTFEGQQYSNSALGFSMLAPGGWSFYTAAQNQAAVDRNRQAAARVRDANLETSADNTRVLFQAIPPKFGGQEKQAILSAGVERLTAKMTLDTYAAAQKALVAASTNGRITQDLCSVTYGGVRFTAFGIEGSRPDGLYRQRYIMTVRGGVAVFLVATIFDDRQWAIVDASLKTIRFK
jgi:hypothetical protein